MIFVLAAFAAKAQNAEYTLSSFTAPYVELTGATVYGDNFWDDPEIVIDPGFPIILGNESISPMLQVGFGAEWGTFNETSFSSMGYFMDIISSANVDEPGAPSFISWLTTGPVGDRIFKIEYKDVAFYGEYDLLGTAVNRVNFQLWFYENGSAIEYRFGPSNIVDAFLVYEGMEGPGLAMIINLQDDGEVDLGLIINGDPANPSLLTFQNTNDFDEEVDDIGLTGTPADGQVYRLDRLVVSTSDQEQAGFQLYPTIAEQELRLSGALSAAQHYRIVNVSGAAVQNGVLDEMRVDVSSLAPGVYLMQVDGHMKAQKFVKR